jgi:hypothetical protein
LLPYKKYWHCVVFHIETLVPHTHHQSGSVKHRHRQIVDTGLSLFAQSHIPF